MCCNVKLREETDLGGRGRDSRLIAVLVCRFSSLLISRLFQTFAHLSTVAQCNNRSMNYAMPIRNASSLVAR
jgi:hypothetical protein